MRHGIIGDIHANLDALDAVLKTLDREKVDQVLCIGDVVGYGAEPGPCLQRLRARGIDCVAGNHDYATANRLDITYFNQAAKQAIEWTRAQLDEEEIGYLGALELVRSFDSFTIVHSSLDEPGAFEYVLSWPEAQRCLDRLPEGHVCFIGHSHVPVTFIEASNLLLTADAEVDLRRCGKALVNVGSVGQPRDQNPNASCVIFNDETRQLRRLRIPYDIDSAARKITEAGLPSFLAERLHVGR